MRLRCVEQKTKKILGCYSTAVRDTLLCQCGHVEPQTKSERVQRQRFGRSLHTVDESSGYDTSSRTKAITQC